MHKPKFVAVTQRVKYDVHYKEFRDELDHRYIDWILASGYIPVPVPNNLTSPHLASRPTISNWLDVLNIQAIVLTGGNDIGEFKQRDDTENFLLSWAEKKCFPVLGICRGMQLMGVRDGAELIKVPDHAGVTHKVNIHNNVKQSMRTVNSYHNYALNKCPKSFELIASSKDGLPEAILHKTLPWQAWMWHPEREINFCTQDLLQFQELINNV